MKKLIVFLLCTFLQVGHGESSYYWQQKQESADKLFASGQFSGALDTYKHVAEETASRYSQFRVAWIYEKGLGVERSCKEAARWYTLAANSGDQAAQNNLFVLYRNGCPDLTPNKGLALQYLEMAVKSGNSRAQANLGRLYADGDSVSNNPYLAYDLAQRSAEKSDIAGIVLLARLYASGIGVPSNNEKAYALLTSAATMNVDDSDRRTKQEAQYLLGEFFAEGQGVPKNLATAYQWLLLARSGPDNDISQVAKKRLGELEAVLPDDSRQQAANKISAMDAKSQEATQADVTASLRQALAERRVPDAIRLARLLAEQESVTGETVLGQMFRDGYGSIAQDLDEAYVLFKRACKSGNWEACAYQVDVLVKMKRSDDAKALLQSIAPATPKADESQLLLAQLYFDSGSATRAEEILRNILVGDPINKGAKELLSAINKTVGP